MKLKTEQELQSMEGEKMELKQNHTNKHTENNLDRPATWGVLFTVGLSD